MAADSRTEAPTQRRREEAREEGRAAISRDLAAGIGLLAAALVARVWWRQATKLLAEATRWTLGAAPHIELTAGELSALQRSWWLVCMRVLGPVVVATMCAGLAASLAQTRLMFSLKPLQPTADKLSPVNGLKRMFSTRGMVEAGKGVLKVTVILGVAAWSLWSRREDLYRIADCSALAAVDVGLDLVFQMVLRCGGVLLLIGGADYGYQHWEFERSLRMSRQELIDEMRRSEGDPHMRARRRALRLAIMRQGISRETRHATVVVTNPTHIAVALLYKPGMLAPRVVAKGRFLVAKRIVQIAGRHGIPVVRNIQLARALFKHTSLGEFVPGALYEAVAQVIAAIYRRRMRLA